MKLLLISNIILSAVSLIGCIIWAVEDDIYTLTSIYGFYWFVSIFSLISGLIGYLFHETSLVNRESVFLTKIKKRGYGIYIMFFYSFIMSLFWLCASASVARVSRDCLYIKNKYSSIIDYYYSKFKFTCNGEIVTMTFGFILFVLWGIVVFLVGKKLYLQIMEKVLQDGSGENMEDMTNSQELANIETSATSEKLETSETVEVEVPYQQTLETVEVIQRQNIENVN